MFVNTQNQRIFLDLHKILVRIRKKKFDVEERKKKKPISPPPGMFLRKFTRTVLHRLIKTVLLKLKRNEEIYRGEAGRDTNPRRHLA